MNNQQTDESVKNPGIEPLSIDSVSAGSSQDLSRALEESVQRDTSLRLLTLSNENESLRRLLRLTEQSRDEYLNLYELAPVGYLTLDLHAYVSDINQTGSRLLGIGREQIVNRPFGRFVAQKAQNSYRRLLQEVTAYGEPKSIDITIEREDGTTFCAQLDCVRVAAQEISSPLRITIIDITQRKADEAEIRQLAFYDPLTSLPNRRLLLDRLQHAFLECTRTHEHGAIFFIDLNDFKSLNDTQGHLIGDLLLKQVAQRLTAGARASDTVARLGGDEFIVMVQHLSSNPLAATEQANAIGEKILAVFTTPFLLGTHQYGSTGSVGITLFKDNHTSVEDLLKRADMALYQAKTVGENSMCLYDHKMQAMASAREALDVDLRRALIAGEFMLHYQPKVDLSGTVTGAEALIRWNHPKRGLQLPNDFIAFAEEKGLIGLIGQWVLEAACVQLVEWSADARRSHLTIAINVSALEFAHPEYVSRTMAVIDRLGIDPEKLILEFTERVMLGVMNDTLKKMNLLKERGFYFSLDDFGIGYSSLAYLQLLPLDELKIDRTFIQNILTNPNDAVITGSIVALGASLGLTVIAEGVETAEQLEFLNSIGCRSYQGYLFGRPCPPDELRI